MPSSVVSIPRPCRQSRAVLTPTEAGYHCAACATEVVDFTRLSETDILAYLAARPGQRVCAVLAAPAAAWPPKRPRGLRRWLLGLAALLGLSRAPAAGLPPQQAPTKATLRGRVALGAPLTIRGVVLDDEYDRPLAGAYVFVHGTKYGAVTNERGEFVLSFAADWRPARGGTVQLDVSAGHFEFVPQAVAVTLAEARHGAALLVRLLSRPGRGQIVGKVKLVKPPVPPPGSAKTGH